LLFSGAPTRPTRSRLFLGSPPNLFSLSPLDPIVLVAGLQRFKYGPLQSFPLLLALPFDFCLKPFFCLVFVPQTVFFGGFNLSPATCALFFMTWLFTGFLFFSLGFHLFVPVRILFMSSSQSTRRLPISRRNNVPEFVIVLPVSLPPFLVWFLFGFPPVFPVVQTVALPLVRLTRPATIRFSFPCFVGCWTLRSYVCVHLVF